MTLTISGLDDVSALLARLPEGDEAAAAAWAAREPRLTKPAGSLGRLEDLSGWLSTWQGRHPPRLDAPYARIFAGNHGVAALGVSAFPAEVTVQMVANFQHGGAAINQLCRAYGVGLDVVSLDLDRPTADFTQGPALTEAEFVNAFQAGIDAVPEGADLLVLGEMGIGNTTPAAALACALYGGEAVEWTGRGTGVEGGALARKIEVVAAGVARHRGLPPLEILRALGGRELVALAGATVAARFRRVPVLLDGYVVTAAVAALEVARPGALAHCRVAHVSAEPGHRRLLAALGADPLLDLGLRLGEGSGAALAVGLLRGAIACHNGMATFDEAGVSDKG
ncbi:nicotinate-nucleotide--dimethylbenzimidazole phosphoribosyltransferase [Magnetospirillum fulvum]|uniref:Nicotinate-nucleotide--dimethylbenzimidazole phosphoribosyltransferase n=1 Tax=Magnetospirillum fulvum MGU-K5 TaxID=1316936 RepID=S9TLW3_MAGFU|nr:nicotinate-nucleotide--dimethylbenzimidazole phosphoribosyltransferase [Magnetospirillum fulvum]EPY03271.1 NaMN:DMB phosphoribosyltransferase [Magnetospirillum fulvum MGU-K5]